MDNINPGPVWLRMFKPWIPRPVMLPPAVQNIQGFISPSFTTGSSEQQWNYGVLGYRWTFGNPEN